MKIVKTRIPDLKIIEPALFEDERGYFMETWNQKQFEQQVTGQPIYFVQDNHSKSQKGTLRGLHYQIENTQGKLVRVISGEVFDVQWIFENNQIFLVSGLAPIYPNKININCGYQKVLPMVSTLSAMKPSLFISVLIITMLKLKDP